ncbi:MAG: hypothetical protein M1825_001466 [Sarcosagium campestre]|nr:MAG: hypothetical protein M1825_001466 [Sarcosagium campestre]
MDRAKRAASAILGKDKPPVGAAGASDDDFADFAGAPDPSPASAPPLGVSQAGVPAAFATAGSSAVPYTAWYRVWERSSPKDFVQEAILLPFLVLAILVHFWGTKKNRRIAQRWITAHQPLLEEEYAVVGYGGPRPPSVEDVQASGLQQALASESVLESSEVLKQRTALEYSTYASGRQNVAFSDVRIYLYNRHNPLSLLMEYAVSTFFDTFPTPSERLDLVSYLFDGKEDEMVPVGGGQLGREVKEQRKASSASRYDNFVWAVVHKEGMKRLRDERYDISLTGTKDHPKLPSWATVMSENAEITEHLLTPELISAVESAGDLFGHLIISDQPLDKPLNLDDTVPQKRIFLTLRLPSSPEDYSKTRPIFAYTLRLPDLLVSVAHFRPDVMKKVRQTRDEQIRKLRRAAEDEQAEERAVRRDREKKEKREATLKGMSAEEQRKYLEKEREKGQRKNQKRMTQKG